MFRFILIACLMAFVVPAQGFADTGIGKVKIGGGLGVTPNIGPAASVGFAVPGLNQGDFLALIEGTFEQASESNFGISVTGRVIGANALGLYPYEQWYFFGGVGLARVTGEVSFLAGIEELGGLEGSSSAIKFQVTAGAGMNINELLFAEVRWSHRGADLVVTVGVKIH